MIYRRYQIKELGFYWLIAEMKKEEDLAFGHANLNDDQMAEWGYVGIKELIDNGAELDRRWTPHTYEEAMEMTRIEKTKS